MACGIRFVHMDFYQNKTAGQKKYQRPVKPMPYGGHPVWRSQIPYEIPDFDKVFY